MKKLIVGINLKMYMGIAGTVSLLDQLHELLSDLKDELALFVLPSFTSLSSAAAANAGRFILLGAQNMHPEPQGQYTGEVSPLMLQEIGLDLVEIGHSDRRHIFKETDEDENAKVLSTLAHGFIALLCIGETGAQKQSGISDEVLRQQLEIGLKNVKPGDADRIWIAYEPVWAIGVNGIPASPEYIKQKHAFIRDILDNLFPETRVPVLYGGSVNHENAGSFIALENVDGLFVARAGCDAPAFSSLVRQVLDVWRSKRLQN